MPRGRAQPTRMHAPGCGSSACAARCAVGLVLMRKEGAAQNIWDGGGGASGTAAKSVAAPRDRPTSATAARTRTQRSACVSTAPRRGRLCAGQLLAENQPGGAARSQLASGPTGPAVCARPPRLLVAQAGGACAHLQLREAHRLVGAAWATRGPLVCGAACMLRHTWDAGWFVIVTAGSNNAAPARASHLRQLAASFACLTSRRAATRARFGPGFGGPAGADAGLPGAPSRACSRAVCDERGRFAKGTVTTVVIRRFRESRTPPCRHEASTLRGNYLATCAVSARGKRACHVTVMHHSRAVLYRIQLRVEGKRLPYLLTAIPPRHRTFGFEPLRADARLPYLPYQPRHRRAHTRSTTRHHAHTRRARWVRAGRGVHAGRCRRHAHRHAHRQRAQHMCSRRARRAHVADAARNSPAPPHSART
jgi:hypothetical protein